jgi:hypothetical protein
MGLMKTRRHAFARRGLHRYGKQAISRLLRTEADGT